MELDKLELECGVTLELQAVNQMLILDLLENIKQNSDGSYDITGLGIRDLNKLMKYLCGWGVKNDVPPDQIEAVEIFGDGAHVQRAAWVRMIATKEELPQIFGQVMVLTRMEMQAQNVKVPTPQEQELARLKEENERLRAEADG